jgi:hypothetical protein
MVEACGFYPLMILPNDNPHVLAIAGQEGLTKDARKVCLEFRVYAALHRLKAELQTSK